MRQGVKLLVVLGAAVAGLLLLPGWSGILIMLALMFVLGWLVPDHPVAAATIWYGLSLTASLVTLAVATDCWLVSGCGVFYPLGFDLAPVLLFEVVQVAVYLFVGWGWMVVTSYMGAGLALRRRIRATA